MFENPRRGRQARNFTTNVPKILDLKSSSKQIFLEHWHWVPLITSTLSLKKNFAIFERIWYPFEWLGVSVQKKFSSIWTAWAICSEKIVVRLNSLFYPFQKKLSSAWTAWAVCWKKLSSPRMAWDIRFKKLLSVRMARAIHSKKKLSTVGGTEPICSKINFSWVSIPKPFHL